ncbi:MAG: nitroreductase family deazaflavin-dependent oxidoreductase [Antricoccus sp.]
MQIRTPSFFLLMMLDISSIAARALTTRWFVRSPVALYRVGLGSILGRRLLMLEHRGRRSGQPRYVCLEVVERPATDRLVVVSGFGTKAQWYQNLQSNQDCFVSVGRLRRASAVARFMSAAESSAALAPYAQTHPAAWNRLKSAIERTVGHQISELPMVELTLSPR